MDLRSYQPLHVAALRGDWEAAKLFFDHDKDAATARITEMEETALVIAARTGEKASYFVRELMKLMTKEALLLPDHEGDTALHIAASVGNKELAEMLVQENEAFPNISNSKGQFPIMFAAKYKQKQTLDFLLTVTKDSVETSPFAGSPGVELLTQTIHVGFFDVALELVERHPHLATLRLDNAESGNPSFALETLAQKPDAFLSGSRLNFCQRLIYSCVPIIENQAQASAGVSNPTQPVGGNNGGDIENQAQAFAGVSNPAQPAGGNLFYSGCQKLQILLWKSLELLVPHVLHIQNEKIKHQRALQLLKFLCKEIRSLNDPNDCSKLYADAAFEAATVGIPEVIEEIVDVFPFMIWYSNEHNQTIFHLAVLHRNENVFNLVYQMGNHKHFPLTHLDESFNSVLHLAGRMAPPHKLQLVSGAALQMQRELQWFKEVEKFTLFPDLKNKDKKTPATIFREEHKDLVKQGEKWMRSTANSCTIAATLIATVVFAAAITVPGGNKGDTGRPVLSKEYAFIVFVVSDAISLFTSTMSLLMFLSILTSRYAEGDFLHVLPKRLIIGLFTLFLSITTMVIAFSAILHLVFGYNNAWILCMVAAMACLPISSFVFLQFPLLVDLMFYTYGRGIFGKKSDRPLI